MRLKALKIISILILLPVVLRFIALLDLICFDFGYLAKIGGYLPSWIFGLIGIGINIALGIKAYDEDEWRRYSVISAIFCAFVILLELYLLWVLSQI